MSRKKGMSRDDKLMAMQELMMETKDVYTLKELEKDCPKKKGITSMVVKEILQELCDCDLISFDKIGSGNFYWCFPSEALNRRKVQETKLEKEICEQKEEIARLEEEISQLQPGREPSSEREKLDQEIAEIQAQIDVILAEASKYDKLNPETIKKMQNQAEVAVNAANRWTDNIFTLKSYCVKHFGVDKKQFDKQFEIPEELDYLS